MTTFFSLLKKRQSYYLFLIYVSSSSCIVSEFRHDVFRQRQKHPPGGRLSVVLLDAVLDVPLEAQEGLRGLAGLHKVLPLVEGGLAPPVATQALLLLLQRLLPLHRGLPVPLHLRLADQRVPPGLAACPRTSRTCQRTVSAPLGLWRIPHPHRHSHPVQVAAAAAHARAHAAPDRHSPARERRGATLRFATAVGRRRRLVVVRVERRGGPPGGTAADQSLLLQVELADLPRQLLANGLWEPQLWLARLLVHSHQTFARVLKLAQVLLIIRRVTKGQSLEVLLEAFEVPQGRMSLRPEFARRSGGPLPPRLKVLGEVSHAGLLLAQDFLLLQVLFVLISRRRTFRPPRQRPCVKLDENVQEAPEIVPAGEIFPLERVDAREARRAAKLGRVRSSLWQHLARRVAPVVLGEAKVDHADDRPGPAAAAAAVD
mmetsp:Transcript_14358/g.36221  ORF Transcript_14358/g.36221 Transcript_14358/m.36221 type:complete len:429 (-) Transcript_14358:25-1311(-)